MFDIEFYKKKSTSLLKRHLRKQLYYYKYYFQSLLTFENFRLYITRIFWGAANCNFLHIRTVANNKHYVLRICFFDLRKIQNNCNNTIYLTSISVLDKYYHGF